MSMLAEISLVFLIASAFRTAFGFGEALIAVPLLALFIPIQVAAPVAVLASILIALVVVLKDWKHIHLQGASRLILSTLPGIPIGLLLLKFGSEALVKGVLAVVLLVFSAYSLLKPRRQDPYLKNDRYAWVFGFLAGIFGGSYGVNGPPLAIYGSLRGWEPEKFRATLQGYFLPASIVGMCGYAFTGLWTMEVSKLFLSVIPAVAVGIFLGRVLSRKVNAQHFSRALNLTLALLGCILVFQAVKAFGG